MTNSIVLSTEKESNLESVDYYEILGVDPRATPPEIRKAYRKAAQRYHPDRNKDPKAVRTLARIQEAYDVLSNLDSRTYYDNVGEKPPSDIDMDASGAQLADESVANILGQCVQQKEIDVSYSNIVRLTLEFLDNEIHEFQEQRQKAQSYISKFENAQKRLKHKKRPIAETKVGAMIVDNVKELKKTYSVAGVNIKIHVIAVKYVREYEYATDKPKAPEAPSMRGLRFSDDDFNRNDSARRGGQPPYQY